MKSRSLQTVNEPVLEVQVSNSIDKTGSVQQSVEAIIGREAIGLSIVLAVICFLAFLAFLALKGHQSRTSSHDGRQP